MVLYQSIVVPPSLDELDVLVSAVANVEERKDTSARAATFYLDITLAQQQRHLRYYDNDSDQRARVLTVLREDGPVEFWVVKPSARRGLYNEVWQIRKQGTVIVSYDELVNEGAPGRTVALSGVAICLAGGLGCLFKAWRTRPRQG